jgi:hypothetical protein
MDYDTAIADIVAVLKADKRVTQPWRNYGLKAANELQAFIRMGLTTTDRQPPDAPVFPPPRPLGCICTDDMPARKDCPVHGTPK